MSTPLTKALGTHKWDHWWIGPKWVRIYVAHIHPIGRGEMFDDLFRRLQVVSLGFLIGALTFERHWERWDLKLIIFRHYELTLRNCWRPVRWMTWDRLKQSTTLPRYWIRVA